jgi:hypothetical protein
VLYVYVKHTLSLYGSTALWTLAAFFSFLIYTQSVGLFGRGISRRKAATYTQNNTNTEWMHTDIHALSGIRTHDPSVKAGEEISWRRPRDYCDRRVKH